MASKSDSKSAFRRNLILKKTLTRNPNPTAISSSFFQSIHLHDWWLIKAQGNGLAVGGLSYRETQGVRVFCSTAIATRHDATTLETADGFTISICGFINRSRTLENGFPSEVCSRFLIGFPYNWEENAVQCSGNKSSDGCVPTRVSFCENGGLPDSLEVPVTRVRDLLMSTLGESGSCALTKSIFSNILENLDGKASKQTGDSYHSKTHKKDSAQDDDTPSKNKRAKVNHKLKESNVVLDDKLMRTEEHKDSTSLTKTPNRGITTRSMSRRNNTEDNPSLSISARKVVCGLPASSLTSRLGDKKFKGSHATKLTREAR